MDKFKELSFEEMQEIDGGIFPILAAIVIGAGKVASWVCMLLVADIVSNWPSYSNQLDAKLANCK
jgi:lactobin A/cerein 7B family class IIb bacteriocin